VVRVALEGSFDPIEATDLTRTLLSARPGAAWDLEEAPGELSAEALSRWQALALVAICADMAGVMRGTLDRAVEYAKERIQYDVPIGSFQAIQHLLAEMLVRTEATASTTRYAAWALDALDADEALTAARTAKAYASVAAREVCEGSMQVFGGIGQTWEHVAHIYTRRGVLGCAALGDETFQLDALAAQTLGELGS
jgi:alkylation response protein AidB-like acyl-CoA dehydrogenase